jgi:hypothetical protein
MLMAWLASVIPKVWNIQQIRTCEAVHVLVVVAVRMTENVMLPVMLLAQMMSEKRMLWVWT